MLPVWGRAEDKVAALLYALDLGDYSRNARVPGYGWIGHDQVQWYLRQSQQWNSGTEGDELPALAFFHIPFPEYQTVWDQEICYGSKNESVCSARTQAGFFSAMLDQGDVMATFCGHDHVNDYWGELYGIRLYYGRATGFNTYGKEGFNRGARVIRLIEGERKLESWLRLDDGSVVGQQPEHLPGNP